MSDREEENRE